MITKEKLVRAGVFLSIMMMGLYGCQNDSEDVAPDPADEQAVSLLASVDAESDDIVALSEWADATFKSSSGGKLVGDCPEITYDEELHQKTIDFGDGCKGKWGKRFMGKIVITYSYDTAGSKASKAITFEEFFVSNKEVSGMILIERDSANDEGYKEKSVQLDGLTITFPHGGTIVFDGIRTWELIEGGDDDNPINNVFRITGQLNVEAFSGRYFHLEIVEPIIAKIACLEEGFMAKVSGIVEITKIRGNSSHHWTIDYGDGECDNEYVVTRN